MLVVLFESAKLTQYCHHTTEALLHHEATDEPTLKLVSQHFKHTDSEGSVLGGDELFSFSFKLTKASNNQTSFTHDSEQEQCKKET